MSCVSYPRCSEHQQVRFRTISDVLAPPLYPLPVFPHALPPPDITPWLKGNCGIDGVHHFEAPAPGPHVVITALMHGNEYAGAYALNALLAQKLRPERGKLSLIYLNLKAFEQFDPQRPTLARFIQEDMNRLWAPELICSDHTSYEMTRVRAVIPLIKTADRLLDIHSMFWDSPPILLCSETDRSLRLAHSLASYLPAPPWSARDYPCQTGLRLIDHPRFVSDTSQATACLLETGQHWNASSKDLASLTARLFPELCGVLPLSLTSQSFHSAGKARCATITHAVKAHTDKFVFIKQFHNGDLIRKQGTLLALDGSEEIRTPYDNCLLVLPNLRPARTHIAIRLAQCL